MRLMVGVLVLASVLCAEDLPKFMGRTVTVTEPELRDDDAGLFPKGPASICIEGPPERQCHTMTEDYGRDTKVKIIQLDKSTPALLFSAAGGGVSGWSIQFALLQPGKGKELDDLFLGITVSNQNQHAFWNEPTISPYPIFVTADSVWGPDETHYGPHRYVISAYVRLREREIVELNDYHLDDGYMTVRKYAGLDDGGADILGSEKQEILARLRRVKAERERQK